MKKHLFTIILYGLTGLCTMNSCTSEVRDIEAESEANSRSIIDFYEVFTSYCNEYGRQQEPVTDDEMKVFQAVFSAAAARWFAPGTCGDWDAWLSVHQSIYRNAFGIDVSPRSGGSRDALEPLSEDSAALARALEESFRYEPIGNVVDHGEIFADIINTLYEKIPDIFTPRNADAIVSAIDLHYPGIPGFTLRGDSAFNDMDHVEAKLTDIFQNIIGEFNMDSASDALAAVDGNLYTTLIIPAFSRALETIMAIQGNDARTEFIEGFYEWCLSPANYTKLMQYSNDDTLDKFFKSISVATYATGFWKVYYGLERDPSIADPQISVMVTGGIHTIGAEETELNFVVSSNYPWEGGALSTMVILDPYSGPAGQGQNVTVSFPRNNGSNARSFFVGFVCVDEDGARAEASITIEQQAFADPEIKVELINGATNLLSADENIFKVRVTSNYPWSYQTSFPQGLWMVPYGGQGGESDAIVTVVPNFGETARSFTMTFTATAPNGRTKQDVLTFYQTLDEDYEPYLNFNRLAKLVFPQGGGNSSITVTSNTLWTTEKGEYIRTGEGFHDGYYHIIPDGLSWYSDYTVTPEIGLNNAVVRVAATPNPAEKPRVGELTFVSYDHQVKRSVIKSLSFFQHGAPPQISLSPSSFKVPRGLNEQTRYEVTVDAPEWVRWTFDESGVFYPGIQRQFSGTQTIPFVVNPTPPNPNMLPHADIVFRFYYNDDISFGTKQFMIIWDGYGIPID